MANKMMNTFIIGIGRVPFLLRISLTEKTIAKNLGMIVMQKEWRKEGAGGKEVILYIEAKSLHHSAEIMGKIKLKK